MRPVPDEHVEAVLPLLTPPVRAMVQVQRLSGMRPGEAVIMRPCDIDRTAGGTCVYRPASHWRLDGFPCIPGLRPAVMRRAVGGRAGPHRVRRPPAPAHKLGGRAQSPAGRTRLPGRPPRRALAARRRARGSRARDISPSAARRGASSGSPPAAKGSPSIPFRLRRCPPGR
jgi:hypothetical protein